MSKLIFLLVIFLSLSVNSQTIQIPTDPEGKGPVPRSTAPLSETQDGVVILKIPGRNQEDTDSAPDKPGVLTIDDEDLSPKIKIPTSKKRDAKLCSSDCEFVSEREIQCPDGRSFILNSGTNQSLRDVILKIDGPSKKDGGHPRTGTSKQ